MSGKKSKPSLKKLREDIDEVDSNILSLLNQRAKIVKTLGQVKAKDSAPIYDPTREKKVIQKLSEKNQGPLSKTHVTNIYREIFSVSRNLQKPMKVAYLGPKTTFTHMATVKQFGSSVMTIPESTIFDVFQAVEQKRADFGVVPIENSIEGTVNNTLDMFVGSKLNIVGEEFLEIHHCFLSKSHKDNIQVIYSHPQAFAQCRKWLQKHYPAAALYEVNSTALAAERAANQSGTAAIASRLAAKEHNLKILYENIEDQSNNVTRFFILGHQLPKKSGKDKTSIMFSVPHESGSLFKAIAPFAKYQLSMTKIESRPTREQHWEYVFFIDFEGFIDDTPVKAALEELKKATQFVRVIGCYPSSSP
ncbi:MAG: prephenate dehydratase [Candidatus Ranarchaeia archaeon]|jgi:chorismate mutase/prephenate dehydratase